MISNSTSAKKTGGKGGELVIPQINDTPIIIAENIM